MKQITSEQTALGTEMFLKEAARQLREHVEGGEFRNPIQKVKKRKEPTYKGIPGMLGELDRCQLEVVCATLLHRLQEGQLLDGGCLLCSTADPVVEAGGYLVCPNCGFTTICGQELRDYKGG